MDEALERFRSRLDDNAWAVLVLAMGSAAVFVKLYEMVWACLTSVDTGL